MSRSHDAYVGRLILGRFRICRKLAVGGMGTIYLARHEGAEGFVKPVVVKRILPDLLTDESMVKMFVREAKILASLRHPGIVAVSDFTREGDDYVMVMEYVRGFNLARWLRHVKDTGRRFPVEVALEIMIEVLEALHYAHTLTDPDGKRTVIVHRDVTPSNVLVDVSGAVKLLDFGIARSSRDATEPDAEGPKVKGKFPYIAPEIFAGAEPSARTDVYAAAVLLHEVLSGRNEIAGPDMQTTLYNAIQHVPRRLDELRDDVLRSVADAVAKGLSKHPDGRYATAREFATALRDSRVMDTDDARDLLRREASRDFLESDLATRQGIDDLSTLDSAWRERTVTIPPKSAIESERTPPSATEGTAVDVAALLHPKPRSLAWVWILAVALALGGGAAVAAVLVLRQSNTPQGAQYVYVQGAVTPTGANDPGTSDPHGTSGHDTPRAAVDASTLNPATNPATTSADAAVAARAPDAGAAGAPTEPAHVHHDHPPPDPTVLLSRIFSRQQSRISHCFEHNSAEVTGNEDNIAVRFQVESSGNVADAHIVPTNLESTHFGSCILSIARTVNFGEQPGRIAFRIPITVRRVAGPQGR